VTLPVEAEVGQMGVEIMAVQEAEAVMLLMLSRLTVIHMVAEMKLKKLLINNS